MGAQAKIINMLLYDGTLDGVLRIEDSNWNAGELFSSPRESVSELIETGACNKYGVYMLISTDMVYIGQSSDLAKRVTQHIAGKDWWSSVIILTTKDDSLNHSDIDYLENVLIQKALDIKKLDCDNKKSGNPPKVDVFRKVFLGQYLEEALFLMQLIGVKIFVQEKKQRRSKKKSGASPAISIISNPADNSDGGAEPQSVIVPDLPEQSLKIGEFVYTAMYNLASSGYIFEESRIDEMCTPEWSKEHFHTAKPFMKRFIPGKTDNKGIDGYVRFRADPVTFGACQVLISKEWYERQREFFVSWYATLK